MERLVKKVLCYKLIKRQFDITVTCPDASDHFFNIKLGVLNSENAVKGEAVLDKVEMTRNTGLCHSVIFQKESVGYVSVFLSCI